MAQSSQWWLSPLSLLQCCLDSWTQFVKTPVTKLVVGVPQSSLLGPLQFAVHCSPGADVMQTAEYSTTSRLMICSSTLPCMLTIQPLGCPFSLHAPLTSDITLDSGTCRTVWFLAQMRPATPSQLNQTNDAGNWQLWGYHWASAVCCTNLYILWGPW